MEKTFLGVIAGAVDERVIRAVRGEVDFISYAHFEVHTEASLENMDKAWSAIHENKNILVELGIRKTSTYRSSTHLSTTSLQSAHMVPLTATIRSLQSDFISILRRRYPEQAIDETIQRRWQPGCLVMKCSYAG
jgi:hypothetical protein